MMLDFINICIVLNSLHNAYLGKVYEKVGTFMETKILLENGTNELEILEFKLDGNVYGINVAKIKEIITYQPVTPVPNAHPSIE